MVDKAALTKLRKKTGLGFMDCKKALEEAKGDLQKALEILFERRQTKGHKKLGRDIEQGAIIGQVNEQSNVGVLIALGCESDFVAKNEVFIALAKEIATVAIAAKASDKESLLTLKLDDKTVQEKIMEHIGVLGENISLEEYHIMEGPTVATYIHTGNKLGVIVTLNQSARDDIEQAAKDMALHIAAMSPLAIDQEDMDPELLNKQREVIAEELAKENKPEAVKEKIATGKLNKFVASQTLLPQKFIKDNDLTCKTYLAQVDPSLTVTAFKRIVIDK